VLNTGDSVTLTSKEVAFFLPNYIVDVMKMTFFIGVVNVILF